jgi:hypothetical protein
MEAVAREWLIRLSDGRSVNALERLRKISWIVKIDGPHMKGRRPSRLTPLVLEGRLCPDVRL